MEEEKYEHQSLEHLANIETELEAIKERTPNPRQAFLNGLLSGAGALVGSIIAIVILGWVLSLLGIIPGFNYIVKALQDASAHFNPR